MAEAGARGEPRMRDAAVEVLTIRSRLPDGVAPQRAWPQRMLARALNLAPAADAAERQADARQIMSLARSLARGERLEELLASQAVATHAAAMSSSHRGMWRSADDRIAQGHMRCAAQLFAVATRQNEMLKGRRERAAATGMEGGRIVEMTWAEPDEPDWLARVHKNKGAWKDDPEVLAYLRQYANSNPELVKRALAAAPEGEAAGEAADEAGD